jgi:thiamine pyrophosphokinase
MQVLIFANGDLDELEWVRPYLASAGVVIAADGGCHHLFHLDRPPDILIGDLDSVDQPLQDWLEAAGGRVISYPPAKDETDLELALRYAADQYPAAEILIFGALGGRLDQTLANILLLAHPAVADHRVSLVQHHQRAWLAQNKCLVRGQAGDLVSLIPLGGPAKIRLTEGLQWPLKDEILDVGPARGVSNVMTADEASVVVDYGQVLCIQTAGEWSR